MQAALRRGCYDMRAKDSFCHYRPVHMRLVAYGLTMVSNNLITCLSNLAVLVGESELTGGEIELTTAQSVYSG